MLKFVTKQDHENVQSEEIDKIEINKFQKEKDRLTQCKNELTKQEVIALRKVEEQANVAKLEIHNKLSKKINFTKNKKKAAQEEIIEQDKITAQSKLTTTFKLLIEGIDKKIKEIDKQLLGKGDFANVNGASNAHIEVNNNNSLIENTNASSNNPFSEELKQVIEKRGQNNNKKEETELARARAFAKQQNKNNDNKQQTIIVPIPENQDPKQNTSSASLDSERISTLEFQLNEQLCTKDEFNEQDFQEFTEYVQSQISIYFYGEMNQLLKTPELNLNEDAANDFQSEIDDAYNSNQFDKRYLQDFTARVKAAAVKPSDIPKRSDELPGESLCSRKISAVVSPKFVRITRLSLGRDRPASDAHSSLTGFMPASPSMTLRRDAFPASPVNARLSRAPRLRTSFSPCLVERQLVFAFESPNYLLSASATSLAKLI
ncbi:MAG: hypothetical protein WAL30_03565 [Candidatus Aquirickettsiella sp.]